MTIPEIDSPNGSRSLVELGTPMFEGELIGDKLNHGELVGDSPIRHELEPDHSISKSEQKNNSSWPL